MLPRLVIRKDIRIQKEDDNEPEDNNEDNIDENLITINLNRDFEERKDLNLYKLLSESVKIYSNALLDKD